MIHKNIHIPYTVFEENELSADDRQLLDLAKEATRTSYAPYSHFCVGAAVRLKNGETVSGSNQENAAYPSGTCAERCVMFYANAHYSDTPPTTIAIAARGENGTFTPFPITPCGACRQVLLESEMRYATPIRVLLYGSREVWVIDSVSQLLPFRFDADALK